MKTNTCSTGVGGIVASMAALHIHHPAVSRKDKEIPDVLLFLVPALRHRVHADVHCF